MICPDSENSYRQGDAMKNQKPLFRLSWLVIALSLGLQALPASADLVAKLPQVEDPFYMTIAGGRLYIVENSATAHVYSLAPRGVSFVKTFGRKGQGPGEFEFIYLIRPLADHLDVCGFNKLARFSLDGNYIDEVKMPVSVFKGAIYRLGQNFVVRDVQFDEKGTVTTVRLYSKEFKPLKQLGTRTEVGGTEKLNLVSDYYSARVTGDRTFIIDAGKDSILSVFDSQGVRQQEIRLPLKPVKMTAALKEAILKPFKEDRELKSRWADFEKRLFFPDQTPGLEYFDVMDGKIVARTYQYRQNSVEFVLFDLMGRELRRVFLPFTGRASYGILFCFHNGRYFYLRQNEDEETWELWSEEVF
jgi:hypothetical protein